MWTMRTQFTFYESFFEAFQLIRDPVTKAQAYDTLCAYALYNTVPDLNTLPDAIAIAFALLRPVLDTAAERAAAGRLGGRRKSGGYLADAGATPPEAGATRSVIGATRIDAGATPPEAGATLSKPEAKDKPATSKPEAKDKPTASEIEKEKEIENEIEKETECDYSAIARARDAVLPADAAFAGLGGPDEPESRRVDAAFEAWWAAYPRKSGDARGAYIAYVRAVESGASVDLLRDAVQWQLTTAPWMDRQGQYIPSAEKWLRNRGWTEYQHRSGMRERIYNNEAAKMETMRNMRKALRD